jgi:hypothetical protein
VVWQGRQISGLVAMKDLVSVAKEKIPDLALMGLEGRTDLSIDPYQ